MTGQVTIEEVRNGQVPKRKRAPNVTEEIFNEVWRLHDRFPKAMLTELSEMIRGKGMSPIGPHTISNIINRKSKTFEEYLQWKKEILEKSRRKKAEPLPAPSSPPSPEVKADMVTEQPELEPEERKEPEETTSPDRLAAATFSRGEGFNGGATQEDVLRFEARIKLIENKQYALYAQTQRILDRMLAIEKKIDAVADDERRILGRMYAHQLEEAMEA